MNAPQRLYLDHNASTPLSAAARAAMAEALAITGNPSSVHTEGRELRRRIEAARTGLADHAKVAPKQVIFTSGASEAAATILSPRLIKGTGEFQCGRLFVSAIEHPCVLAGGRFAGKDVRHVPVSRQGVVDLDALRLMLAEKDETGLPPMVAIMLANNETGVIQPVADAGEIVHGAGGVFVVDAVQGLGRLPISPAELNADFVFVSAHKAGGPRGIGAIVCGNAGFHPAPLITGGGQENHRRAGTENAVAIVGFGAAVSALSAAGSAGNSGKARDLVEAQLRTMSPAAEIFGGNAERLANTSCFAVSGIKAETALIALDLAGIAASSGSACSSGKLKKSHVLTAMGVSDDLASGALRISFGEASTVEDAGRFLEAFTNIVSRVAVKPRAA
jgi:cysteine desulfurase